MKSSTRLVGKSFSQLSQELYIPLRLLQKSLLLLQQSGPLNPQQQSSLHQAIEQNERINKLVEQLLAVKALTLSDEKYVNFCDLIICGSEMAEYLNANQRCSKTARHHALYWKQVIQEFKPFLKGVLLNR